MKLSVEGWGPGLGSAEKLQWMDTERVSVPFCGGASSICSLAYDSRVELNFSELDVFRVLRSLDVSKAMGCDGITPKILKHCALALYQPFRHLFSLSISQSYLPIKWRTHSIKPIFKSGDKNSVRNYRPVSLLSVVSKVLEKLVYSSTVDFITNSLSDYQFGFYAGVLLCNSYWFSSTLYSTLCLKHMLYTWILEKPSTLWLITSFCTSYGTLGSPAISGYGWELTWQIESSTCLLVNLPQLLHLFSGVPQGIVLSPLLFLIFVNDLPSTVSFCKVLLFADDAKCIMPISSLQDCINLQSYLSRLG